MLRRTITASTVSACALGVIPLIHAPLAAAVPGPEVEYVYNVMVRRHYDFPGNDAIGYGFGICDKVTPGRAVRRGDGRGEDRGSSQRRVRSQLPGLQRGRDSLPCPDLATAQHCSRVPSTGERLGTRQSGCPPLSASCGRRSSMHAATAILVAHSSAAVRSALVCPSHSPNDVIGQSHCLRDHVTSWPGGTRRWDNSVALAIRCLSGDRWSGRGNLRVRRLGEEPASCRRRLRAVLRRCRSP